MFDKGTRGLSWLVSYKYALDSWPLSTYRMEQQASIIPDYYLLRQPGGRSDWKSNNTCKNCDELSDKELLRQYQYTLRSFPWSI